MKYNKKNLKSNDEILTDNEILKDFKSDIENENEFNMKKLIKKNRAFINNNFISILIADSELKHMKEFKIINSLLQSHKRPLSYADAESDDSNEKKKNFIKKINVSQQLEIVISITKSQNNEMTAFNKKINKNLN